MKLNQKGIDLVKKFEGCVLKVYLDAVGLPTCGYGHMDKSMTPGLEISQDLADKLLEADLEKFSQGVFELVNVSLNDNEFSALVCFAFNVGLNNLKQSTLLKKVNKKDWAGAALEFPKWNRAGGMELPGLTKRRQAEAALFLSA